MQMAGCLMLARTAKASSPSNSTPMPSRASAAWLRPRPMRPPRARPAPRLRLPGRPARAAVGEAAPAPTEPSMFLGLLRRLFALVAFPLLMPSRSACGARAVSPSAPRAMQHRCHVTNLACEVHADGWHMSHIQVADL